MFAGGFTLAAAEAVCAGDRLPGERVLDVLGSLVDQSLVIADHVDEFDFRNWAKQALGPSGHLVALLPPLRKKARAKALDQLAAFRRDETGSSV